MNLQFGNLSKKMERTFVVQSYDKRFIFDVFADKKLRVATDLFEEIITVQDEFPLDQESNHFQMDSITK